MAAPIDLDDLHEAVGTRLRAGAQIYTSGRRELVELLARLGRPVSIYDILEARPRLTQSSVYRNLVVLEQVGATQKVASSDDRARFELADDLIGHHHHLVCISCSRVDDFVVPSRSERMLDDLLIEAIADTGFNAAGHRLDVIGTCAACS